MIGRVTRSMVGGLAAAAACLTCETPSRSVPPIAATGAQALMTRGDAIYLEAPDSAASLYRAALSLADSTGDSAMVARALTSLSGAARLRLDFAESRTLGERALSIKLRLRLRNELFRSYNILGLLAWDEGRLRDALQLFQQASAVALATGDSAALAKVAINSGLAQMALGDLSSARASFERGRLLAEAVHDTSNLGRALTNLAALDIEIGDPLSALATIQMARAAFRASGDSLGDINALGQSAMAYDALGEPQRAFVALDSALAKASRRGYRKEEAEDLKILGDFFSRAGDHRRALDQYAQATAAIDSLTMEDERGNLLRNQARSHAALGREDLASRLARDALRVHERGEFAASALNDLTFLADLSAARGDRVGGERMLDSARQVAARLGDGAARSQVILAEARFADAAGESARVLRVLRDAQSDLATQVASTVAEASALRLRAFSRLGQLDAAAAAGRQAIAALERVRGNYGSGELRTAFTADRAGVYTDLVLVLLRLRRTAEAFEIADAARGRALVEHIATARGQIRTPAGALGALLEGDSLLRAIDGLVSQLRERERTIPRERGDGNTESTRELADRISNARTRYETLVAQRASSTDAMVLLGGSARTAGEVQASLAPNEVMLEYFVAPTQLVVFIVRRNGIWSVSTPISGEDLFDRVRLARDLVSRPAQHADDVPVMTGLYRDLVRPVMQTEAFRGVRRIVIVRHSMLSYLPFAALVNPANGRRLIEQFPLLYAPSGAVLSALRSARPRPTLTRREPIVAFAPLPDQLPASRREVTSIADALPGARSVIGPNATERAVRQSLEEAGVIHVATHGVMNVRNPLFSRIELAAPGRPTPSDNGRLETHELLGLRITSRLVFLSGCETSVGDAWATTFDLGEDYTTLARAFLFAGARNVIGSLWRINDDGASELASRFYGWLRTLPAPEALARAQIEMLTAGVRRDPYFWAAFEVLGDGT